VVPPITIKFVSLAPSKGPAFCNIDTGNIYVNIPEFYKYTPAERAYILFHEMGHIKLQNRRDEHAVDEWAFNEYIKAGYKLTDAVKALTQALSNKNKEHITRAQNQFKRAAMVDALNNSYETRFITGGGDSSFLGLSKSAKENRAKKYDDRNARKNKKVDAEYLLAEKGISSKAIRKQNTQNSLGAIGSAAIGITSQALGGGAAGAELGNLFGKAFITNPDGTTSQVEATPENIAAGAIPIANSARNGEPTKKPWYKTTGAIIGFSAAGAASLGGVIYFIKKRK
jgi:hypothetical protein